MGGMFELRTPNDLLNKLHHDYEELQKDRSNSYLAFNFFVTAEHLLDWIYPGRAKSKSDIRSNVRDASLELQVCSHIANGLKHFVAEDRRHKSVAGSHRGPGAGFGSANLGMGMISTGGGSMPRGASLFVKLDGEAAKAFGETVDVLDLARRILDYWNNYEYFRTP